MSHDLSYSTGTPRYLKILFQNSTNTHPNAILIIATNPLDILTYVSQKLSSREPERIIGTGTTSGYGPLSRPA